MTREKQIETLRYHYESAKAILNTIKRLDVVKDAAKIQQYARALALHAQSMQIMATDISMGL